MCELVNNLVAEIDEVSRCKNRVEHSMKEMGKYAHDFLTKEIGILNSE